MSDVLPTYEVEISGTMHKMLIDTGATTIYISQRLVKELGLKTTKVKARKIKLGDGDNRVANEITTIGVKVGNLPTETLAAYVFPLTDLDLVLGIPWMRKHNPHIDFNCHDCDFGD